MISKLKDKFIRFCSWIWQECNDTKTFLLLLLVIAVVYSPVWGGYLLHAIFGRKWASIMASACLVFWAGPFTPFFLICIGITLSIRRRAERRTKAKDVPAVPKTEKAITYAKLFWLFSRGQRRGRYHRGAVLPDCQRSLGNPCSVHPCALQYSLWHGFGSVLHRSCQAPTQAACRSDHLILLHLCCQRVNVRDVLVPKMPQFAPCALCSC